GVDISAPNGTPVFAVEAGNVPPPDPRAVSVVTGDGDLGYLPLVPAVSPLPPGSPHQLLRPLHAPRLPRHLSERRARRDTKPAPALLRPGPTTRGPPSRASPSRAAAPSSRQRPCTARST